ncbi:MAG: TonB-dependent receptor [Cyanobacteria bacterium]|nr:TonB-dependent receptor [Cyanobacteriota bacterium]
MLRTFTAFILTLALGSAAFAQSTANNGTIEGIVKDDQGALLPGVTVTVTNIDTGDQRVVVTNESGLYRAPLLSLGTYRVAAELQGFKKYEQTGVSLRAGQTAVIDVALGVGAVSETITVTADAPLIDAARIDIGHSLSDQEVHALPLVARNPYNFALVQPGVTGIENVEFGVPRLAANGAAMRINYQIDGNTNTQKDRAGLRLLPISEVMIQEVKVVTTGFAPEFGQTMGMVFNAVTPSGTNAFHGQASYLFRRKEFSAFPFFFGCSGVASTCAGPAANAVKPETKVDTGTASVGGPIVKNKLFFYGGWEQTRRDLSSGSLITVPAATVAQLGLKPQPTAAPNVQTGKFKMAKADYQISNAHRANLRWVQFLNDAPYNSGGGINTLERATDFRDAMNSIAGQIVSSFGGNRLNELRVQYAQRHQSSLANSDTGSGPAVTISGIAGFGGAVSGTGQGSAGFDFKQNMTQVIDNFTLLRGNHSFKIGFDYQRVFDERTAAPQFVYTFPTLQAYLDAKAGTNPFSYTTMTQLRGELGFNMTNSMFSAFIQDDWQVSPRFKVLYGLRYDMYTPPAGLAGAPLAQTQKFNVDRNNVGPRLGVAWKLDDRTVLRGSTGIMYDQPILGGYEQALQLSGSPRAPIYSFSPTTAGAPAFPGNAGTGVLAQQSPWAVDPGFQVARTWQSNAQIERAFAGELTMSLSVMYASGDQLPVVTDVNLINPIGTLGDGRPIYSTTVNASTRVDPRFNRISQVQSLGTSTFKSMTVQTTKRMKAGLTFNVQYSLGKGLDNTPLVTQLTVQAEPGRSDPSNLDRDRGPNPLDMRHNFTGNVVYASQNSSDNAIVRGLLNGNELGVLLQFNSGLPVNLVANRDLNGDGIVSDRPLGVARNSLYLPARRNVDLRFTRWIPIHGSTRAEVIAEMKNVFNTQQLSGITTSTPVDTAGNPLSPIPSDAYSFSNASGFEQRKFQLGFRLRF